MVPYSHPLQMNTALQKHLADWTLTSGVSIKLKTINVDAKIEDQVYLDTIQSMCRDSSHDFDLVLLDDAFVTHFESCLIDLWSFNFKFGEGIPNGFITPALTRSNKLLGLPFRTQLGFLAFNADLLDIHGFSTQNGPKNLQQLGDLMTSIIENEKAIDHFNLAGFAAGFRNNSDDIVAFASMLNHGINGSIIDADSGIPIVYSDDYALVLGLFMEWSASGILAQDFLSNTPEIALSMFLAGKSIFFLASPENIASILSAEFKTSTFPIPMYTTHVPYGVANLHAEYLVVNSKSLNTGASIRVLEWMSSPDFQRKMLVTPSISVDMQGSPVYSSFLYGTLFYIDLRATNMFQFCY